jgi:GNAT superfamily N-acetyltransferase
MFVVRKATTARDLARFCTVAGPYPITPETPSMQQADAHWLALENGEAVARCSLWWRNVPPYPRQTASTSLGLPEGRLGLLGHYAAHDRQAANLLLRCAARELARRGCTVAVGPIDGNTFRHYRLVTERSLNNIQRAPFFLEPDNPDVWPADFIQAGFFPWAHYLSAIGEASPADPWIDRAAAGVAAHGIQLRTVNVHRFAEEIRRIYPLVQRSFAQNFLYTPLAEEEFVAQYAPLRAYLQDELVLLAEHGGEPAGFLFALPDLAQAQRGELVDTVIIKTVGVAPEFGGIGLGGLLVAHCQCTAYRLGYRHIIHALMFEDNLSRKISARYAQTMRRYTLFAKAIHRRIDLCN